MLYFNNILVVLLDLTNYPTCVISIKNFSINLFMNPSIFFTFVLINFGVNNTKYECKTKNHNVFF